MSVSEQLTDGQTHQADPHSYPLVIIGFIPLIFAAAIIVTCGECMTGPRGKRSASRTPLMPNRQPKRAKWCSPADEIADRDEFVPALDQEPERGRVGTRNEDQSRRA